MDREVEFGGNIEYLKELINCLVLTVVVMNVTAVDELPINRTLN
jgi:hypothetical protein